MKNIAIPISGRRGRTPVRILQTIAALALVTAAVFGCGTGTVYYDSYYEDPYLYDYYYSADLMYSSYYWAYPWDYGYYVYQTTGYDPSTSQRWSIGNAVRALARGESVCPGQVTVTPRTAPPACGGSAEDPVRSGVTITFNNCQISGGGVVTGTVDVTSSRSASDTACGTSTTIAIQATSTVSNMTVVGADGWRLVIPQQVDTIMSTHTNGQAPTSVTANSQGRLQVYDSSGALISNHDHSGTRVLTYSSASKSYAVTGTLSIQDNQAGGTATLTGTDVTHTMDCCRPTGGTLTVDRTGGNKPGQHTWSFGPSCGNATYDSTQVTLLACR